MNAKSPHILAPRFSKFRLLGFLNQLSSDLELTDGVSRCGIIFRMRKTIVFGVLFILGAAASASAGDRFSVFGDLGHSIYSSEGVTTQGEPGTGAGLGVEFPMGPSSGLEIDAIYLKRKNLIQASYLQVPIVYRLWLGKMFTIGAGAYYAQGMGSVTANGGTETFSAAGYTSNDIGLTGAAGFNIPLSSFNLLVEGRYDLGVYNVSAIQGVTATFNDFQLLVGIRLGSF